MSRAMPSVFASAKATAGSARPSSRKASATASIALIEWREPIGLCGAVEPWIHASACISVRRRPSPTRRSYAATSDVAANVSNSL
jgi:hypothetical protein